MATFVPLLKSLDWSSPPLKDNCQIEGFQIFDTGIKTYFFDELKDVVKWIQSKKSIGTVYTIDISIFLAYLLWLGMKEEYNSLESLVYDNSLVSMEDACKCSLCIRKWKSPFEIEGKPLDARSIDKLSQKWEDWVDYEITNRDLVSSDTLLGIRYETLSRVASYLLTWQGVCVDKSKLENGLDYFDKKEKPIYGKDLTLYTHYRDTKNFLRGRKVHPIYTHLRTQRLGATCPQIQNFTNDHDFFPSRHLLQPDNKNENLLSLDLSMSELFALGVLLSYKDCGYKKSKLLCDLNKGVDIHVESGKIALGSEYDNKTSREVGKIFNFAFLNLSKLQSMNRELSNKCLPTINADNYNKTKANLYKKYGLSDFHQKAQHRTYPSLLKTIQGRIFRVSYKTQYTGFQFQSFAGDANALAVLHLFKKGFKPIILIHDDIVVSCNKEQEEEVIECHKKGIGLLYREAEFKTKTKRYCSNWGIEEKSNKKPNKISHLDVEWKLTL